MFDDEITTIDNAQDLLLNACQSIYEAEACDRCPMYGSAVCEQEHYTLKDIEAFLCFADDVSAPSIEDEISSRNDLLRGELEWQ